MSVVTLIEITARRASDAAPQVLRYVHGARTSNRFVGQSWDIGVLALPEFELDLGFDGAKFGQGATPQVGRLQLAVDNASTRPSLVFKGAAVSLRSAPWSPFGGDPADGDFGTPAAYKVEEADTSASGLLTLTLLDAGQPLRQPVQVRKFGSTADALLDGAGAADHKGKVVPTGWGKLLGIPALLVDRVYNIWLLLDRPASVIHGIYDGGNSFAAGVARASLAALRANVPADGACDVCGNAGGLTLVRPWTAPTYPLTADITASGPTTAAGIAEHIVLGRSTVTCAAGVVAAFDLFQPAICQIYVADERTIGAALDELICRLGGFWKLNEAGLIEMGPLQFTAPAATFEAHQLVSLHRKTVVMPTRRRAVGWGRNNRLHNEGEIATILLAGDIDGLGDLAYLSNVDWALVTGAGRPDTGATRNIDAGNMIRDPITGADWALVGPAVLDVTGGGGPIYDRWRARLGDGGYVAFGPANIAAIRDRFPVSPGETMHAAWYGYRAAGAGVGTFLLSAYDAAGTYLTTVAVPNTELGLDVGGAWVRRVGKIVIPAGWAFVWPHVGYNAGGTGYLYAAYPYWGKTAPGADITGENTALNTLNVAGQSAAGLVADAASSLAAIAIIVSDGYLGRAEKPAIIQEWTAISDEYAPLHARATALGLTGHALWTSYYAARIALDDYLNGLTPTWSNVALDTAIVGSIFRGKFTDYYYARQLLTDLFGATAQATADSKTRNVDRGAWVALAIGAAMVVGDEVQDQGSTWGCILAHAKSALNGPPALPTAENTYWRLRSAKGDTGQTGASTKSIFIRDVTKPATPAPSAGVPSGFEEDPDAIAPGVGPIWKLTGQRAAGATNYVWGGAVRDEALSSNATGESMALGFATTGWKSFTLLTGQTRVVTGQLAVAAPTGTGTLHVQLEVREEGGSSTASNGATVTYAVGEPATASHEIIVHNPALVSRTFEIRGTGVRSNSSSGLPTPSESKVTI
jgi:hypothetical protein